MDYVLTLLEGIVSFLSPCMLPLLPLYVSYFAGDQPDFRRTLARSLAFVSGFTAVFCTLGLCAGTLGGLFRAQSDVVDLVCGAFEVLCGLIYLDVIPVPFLRGMKEGHTVTGVLSALGFGVVFAVNLTPCVGAFLGSALMVAASSGGAAKGLFLLLTYSSGFAIPLILGALALDRLKQAIGFIKRRYRVLNAVCGGFLIFMGLFMMYSGFDRWSALFS